MTLDLTGGHATPQDIFPPCSAGLKKLLTEGDDGNSAVRLIAINRTLRVEVEAVYPLLHAAMAPADPDELLVLIVETAMDYGVDIPEPDWDAVFKPYTDALAAFSMDAVIDGFRRWKACEAYPKSPDRHAVFPRPDELLGLATRGRLILATATNRARKALEHIAKTQTLALTPEERARNVELAQSTLDALKNRARQVMPDAPRPASDPPSDLVRQLVADGLSNTAPPPSVARKDEADPLGDVL